MRVLILVSMVNLLVAGFAPMTRSGTPASTTVNRGSGVTCDAKPLSLARLVELAGKVATPVAGLSPKFNEPVPLPPLSPVDSATEDAVTASAEAMESCFAMSDPLRGLVGFSEDYLTRIAVDEEAEGINSSLRILTDAGYAESVSMAVTAVGTSRMGRLADGRIGVARTVAGLSPGGTPVPESRATVLFVFAEAANGWLLDDVVLIEPSPAGTPTA